MLEPNQHVDIGSILKGVVTAEARRTRVPIAVLAPEHQVPWRHERRAFGVVVITVELVVFHKLGHHAVAPNLGFFRSALVGAWERHKAEL